MSCSYDGRKLFISVYTGRTDKGAFFTRGYKPVDRLSQFITRSPWSPIIYAGGYRKQDNFQYSDWCVLDFDGGYTLDQCVFDFGHFAHIIAPTKRHSDDNHRFRLCIPWATRITSLEVYRYNMRILTERSHSDPSGKDGARFFYPSRFIHSISAKGDVMPVLVDVPPTPKPKPVSVWKGGVLPPKLEKLLRMSPPREGEVNNTLYRLACEFAKRTDLSATAIRQHVEHLIYPNGPMEQRYMTTIESALKRYR